MNHILVAVTDGLKGIGEALDAVFPATTLQTCIVHLILNSLDYASWRDRKLLAAALKPVYQATSAEHAAQALDDFERGPWASVTRRWWTPGVALGIPRNSVLCVPAGRAARNLHG